MCQSLQLEDPSKRVGSKIHYVYKEGRGVWGTQGNLSAYDPPQRITLTLQDKMFALLERDDFESRGQRTQFKYTLEITPKSFAARMLSSVIRRATQ